MEKILTTPMDTIKDLNGPQRQFELFKKFSLAAAMGGFQTEHVIGAAGSLMVDALRQEYDNGRKAEAIFDAVVGQMKACLMSHYDAFGRKIAVNNFPLTPETPDKIRQILKTGDAH